jgi:muramoyltetrapeptide carboxypeptidase
MISRGGYGLTRILPALPYKQIAKAIDGGMQFVGLSDFTAFNQAVLAQTGRITWQGPALGEDFGPEAEPDDIMQACFDDLVLEQGEGAGWQRPKAEADRQVRVKDAMLWGGNLSVLTSLLGTPYFPQTKGGVLFLEDVGEHPYRVERMLTQLLHAGVLAQQKAVLFGQFSSYKLVPAHDKGFKLATVLDWLRGQIKAPVLSGLPFGHVPTKVLLPVGAKVDLVTEGRDALMVWGHI